MIGIAFSQTKADEKEIKTQNEVQTFFVRPVTYAILFTLDIRKESTQ